MNIAVHNSLRGDPMLGDEAMQRFHATRFNDRGQALDAMGLSTSDLACPHCRRKLPPGFLDLPHHIFSIVGAPSSGKSYYLSVLIKVLQSTLFQNFGITFRDADPSENVILTQMKTQLFSSSSPEDAFLAKTDLEGALYETLPQMCIRDRSNAMRRISVGRSASRMGCRPLASMPASTNWSISVFAQPAVLTAGGEFFTGF